MNVHPESMIPETSYRITHELRGPDGRQTLLECSFLSYRTLLFPTVDRLQLWDCVGASAGCCAAPSPTAPLGLFSETDPFYAFETHDQVHVPGQSTAQSGSDPMRWSCWGINFPKNWPQRRYSLIFLTSSDCPGKAKVSLQWFLIQT